MTYDLIRNYTEDDYVSVSWTTDTPLPDPQTVGWSAPSGKQFKEWNSSPYGDGTSYSIGNYPVIEPGPYGLSFFAIWEAIEITEYKTDNIELGAIANAIRTKGGTSASLIYPTGFVSAINAIETGGGTDAEDAIITHTISGTYENSRVTKIDPYVFINCNKLTSVNFPKCSWIGNDAFSYCASLTSVSFPSCTTINSHAFDYCIRLASADFPVCTTIDSYAFRSCSSLTTVSFPVCTSISTSAFTSCIHLTSANFPKCKTIGGYAFSYCPSLTSVSFPSCTTIGYNAFSYCIRLASANFPKCTSIYSNAFNYCTSLTSASFPKCTLIGSFAFESCFKLVSLYLTGSSYVSLANSNAFISTPIGGYSGSAGKYGSIYVKASMLSSYKTATNWTYFSSRMVGV